MVKPALGSYPEGVLRSLTGAHEALETTGLVKSSRQFGGVIALAPFQEVQEAVGAYMSLKGLEQVAQPRPIVCNR